MLDGMAVFILNEKRALIYYIAQIKDWQYSYGVRNAMFDSNCTIHTHTHTTHTQIVLCINSTMCLNILHCPYKRLAVFIRSKKALFDSNCTIHTHTHILLILKLYYS